MVVWRRKVVREISPGSSGARRIGALPLEPSSLAAYPAAHVLRVSAARLAIRRQALRARRAGTVNIMYARKWRKEMRHVRA